MRAVILAATASLSVVTPCVAQREGWGYSPLPGEGDRATMGCALDSDPHEFACLAVRCEDDFSVGLYIHTNLAAGDVGAWWITVDKEERGFAGEPGAAGYGARLAGNGEEDLEWLLDGLKQGAAAFLDPGERASLTRNYIPLDGSLYAINAALAYCAPRLPAG